MMLCKITCGDEEWYEEDCEIDGPYRLPIKPAMDMAFVVAGKTKASVGKAMGLRRNRMYELTNGNPRVSDLLAILEQLGYHLMFERDDGEDTIEVVKE